MVCLPYPNLLLVRSEERFSRNAETDLVCRLLLEKNRTADGSGTPPATTRRAAPRAVPPPLPRGVVGRGDPRQGWSIGVVSSLFASVFVFFNDTATTEIYTLSLHDALPICEISWPLNCSAEPRRPVSAATCRTRRQIGRAVQQECRDRYRMPSSA